MNAGFDKELIKRLIRRLDRDSFSGMINACLNLEYGSLVTPLPELGKDIWHRSIGYVKGAYDPNSAEKADAFYVVQHMPSELFKNPLAVDFHESQVVESLRSIRACKEIASIEYYPEITRYMLLHFMTNFVSSPGQEYFDGLLTKYEALVGELGFDTSHVYVGTCDTYVDQKPTETGNALQSLLASCDATSIRLVPGQIAVQPFSSERNFAAGVTPGTYSPCGPVFVPHVGLSSAVQELQFLLERNPKEAELQKFLKRYYQEVFGPNYTRIETELWLRFPHLDIANKERRIDLFLRNETMRDWELVEIKRFLPLTGTQRDAPRLSREITDGIGQLQHYQSILKQDEVRRKLEADGFDYWEPELRLVIGKSPTIERKQWRELLGRDRSNVKIFTYNDLLADMRIRLEDRLRALPVAAPDGK